MKTMNREWEEYRGKCYPNGLSDTQNREVRQAFFAGGLVVLSLLGKFEELPDDAFFENLDALRDEIIQTLTHHLTILSRQTLKGLSN